MSLKCCSARIEVEHQETATPPTGMRRLGLCREQNGRTRRCFPTASSPTFSRCPTWRWPKRGRRRRTYTGQCHGRAAAPAAAAAATHTRIRQGESLVDAVEVSPLFLSLGLGFLEFFVSVVADCWCVGVWCKPQVTRMYVPQESKSMCEIFVFVERRRRWRRVFPSERHRAL